MWHRALDDDRRACIRRRRRPCVIQPRPKALRKLLHGEEPGSRYREGERVRRRPGRSRLETYQGPRSGVIDAYRAEFLKANSHADPALTRAFTLADRTVFH